MYAKWFITDNCNLRCKHCLHGNKLNMTEQMKLSTAFLIVDELCEFGIDGIQLIGGEPLFYKDINDLFRYFIYKGIYYGFTTNGTLIETIEEELLISNYLSDVVISLESCNENDIIRGNGVYESVIECLKYLSSLRVQYDLQFTLSLSMTINKYSINELEEIISLVQKYSLDSVVMSYVVNTGNAVDHSDLFKLNIDDIIEFQKNVLILADEIRGKILLPFNPKLMKNMDKKQVYMNFRRTCKAGINSISVDSNGKVYMCDNHILKAHKNFQSNILGNILERQIVINESDISEFIDEVELFTMESVIKGMDDICYRCEYGCFPCPEYIDQYYINKEICKVINNGI